MGYFLQILLIIITNTVSPHMKNMANAPNNLLQASTEKSNIDFNVSEMNHFMKAICSFRVLFWLKYDFYEKYLIWI